MQQQCIIYVTRLNFHAPLQIFRNTGFNYNYLICIKKARSCVHTIRQCTVVVEGGVVTGGLQVIKSYTKVKQLNTV